MEQSDVPSYLQPFKALTDSHSTSDMVTSVRPWGARGLGGALGLGQSLTVRGGESEASLIEEKKNDDSGFLPLRWMWNHKLLIYYRLNWQIDISLSVLPPFSVALEAVVMECVVMETFVTQSIGISQKGASLYLPLHHQGLVPLSLHGSQSLLG